MLSQFCGMSQCTLFLGKRRTPEEPEEYWLLSEATQVSFFQDQIFNNYAVQTQFLYSKVIPSSWIVLDNIYFPTQTASVALCRMYKETFQPKIRWEYSVLVRYNPAFQDVLEQQQIAAQSVYKQNRISICLERVRLIIQNIDSFRILMASFR